MNCWKCATSLAEGAAYCSQCGVAQPVRPPRPLVPATEAGARPPEATSGESWAAPDSAAPADSHHPIDSPSFTESPLLPPPAAGFYSAHPPLPASSDPSAVEWIREGWRSFKERPLAVPLFYVVYFVVVMLISALLVGFRLLTGTSLHDLSGGSGSLRELPIRVLLQILLLPLSFGATLYCIAQQRGEQVTPMRFLAGYARPWQIVINQFLICFLAAVLLLPGIVPMALGIPMAALSHAGDWSVLAAAAIPAVLFLGFWILMVTWVVILPLAFSPILIVDQGRGPLAAIGAGWALTRGSRMQLVLFSVLGAVVAVAGILCLFVGFFVSLAVLHGAMAAAYRDMLRRQGTPDQEVAY